MINFYLGIGKDAENRTLQEILDKDNNWFETNHSFIQWLFPTREASGFNLDAPELTDEIIEQFKTNEKLQHNLRTSFLRFLGFLGLDNQSLFYGYPKVFTNFNHNWMRITRVLNSLVTLGLEKEAKTLFEFLNFLNSIPNNTQAWKTSFVFWKKAVMNSFDTDYTI